MRILFVNKFLYPRGGAETYCLELARELASRGHEVQFFGMRDQNNTVGNAA
ncbi:MAG: glycosyltransferase, partial [Clostridia bacterium]|nr:glycosyltransferase [Clostridia bacterium]